MPFTFSHPAIVAPLTRSKYFSATGLLVGSIIPDFEYFLRLENVSVHSHSIEGAFYFDLPLALVVALLFHLLVKRPLIDNLPYWFRVRFQGIRNSGFLVYLKRYWFNFLFSALVGIASHILWDDLTHSHTVAVNTIDILKQPILVGDLERPFYKYLLHGSTIGGLIVMLMFIRLMRKEIHVMGKPSPAYWLLVTAIASAVFWLRALEGFSDSFSLNFVTNVVITIVSAGLLAILTVSSFYTIFTKPSAT